jgi:hypothetical protein
MKLMIIGHARHGKDTVCEILRDQYGLTFRSSSEAAAERVIYPILRDSYGYSTIEECLNDRANHRATWYQLIREYNTPDPTRLAREIYADNDIYCGLRHAEEFEAIKAAGLFDFCIWVDGSERHSQEPASSFSVSRQQADYLLDNNDTQNELRENIALMMRWLEIASSTACPKCRQTAKTHDDTEFLSWHGHCAECAMQEVRHG